MEEENEKNEVNKKIEETIKPKTGYSSIIWFCLVAFSIFLEIIMTIYQKRKDSISDWYVFEKGLYQIVLLVVFFCFYE